MTYDFILDYKFKNDNGLIDINKYLISISDNIKDKYIMIFDKLNYIENFKDDGSKSLNAIGKIKIKMTEELLDNLNREIIKSNDFINYYYWVTNLNLKILIKNIAPYINNSFNFVRDFVDIDKLIIKHFCIKCNKEIILYYPRNRNSRNNYIIDINYCNCYPDSNYIKNYICDECTELIKKEKEIREQIWEKEKEEKRKLRIKEELDYIQELKTMPYQEYLQTEHWRNKRKRALKRANYKCQLCSSKENLQVHHNTYDNRGNEKDEDLIVLCEICHGKFHDK